MTLNLTPEQWAHLRRLQAENDQYVVVRKDYLEQLQQAAKGVLHG